MPNMYVEREAVVEMCEPKVQQVFPDHIILPYPLKTLLRSPKTTTSDNEHFVSFLFRLQRDSGTFLLLTIYPFRGN
jgi:hypothetical protein